MDTNQHEYSPVERDFGCGQGTIWCQELGNWKELTALLVFYLCPFESIRGSSESFRLRPRHFHANEALGLAGKGGSSAQCDRLIRRPCSGDFRHLRSKHTVRSRIRGEVGPDDKVSRDLDVPGDTGFGRTADETDLKIIRALVGQ